MKKIYTHLITFSLLLFASIAIAQPVNGTTTFFTNTTTALQANTSCSITKSVTLSGWLLTISSTSNCGMNWTNSTGGDGRYQNLVGFGTLTQITFGSDDGSEFAMNNMIWGVSTSSWTSKPMTFVGYKNGSPVSGATLNATTPSGTGILNTLIVTFTNNTAFNDVDEIRLAPNSTTCNSILFFEEITIGTATTSCTTPTLNVTGSSNVLCNGGSTGSATMAASGGSGFTYTWFPSGGNSSTASGLSAGIYTLYTTNSCSSIDSQTIQITEPGSALATSTAVNNVLCNGGSGSASITATGGTGGYTYLWSNAATSSVVSGIVAGVYTATVTDGNSCTSTKSVVVTQPTALSTSTSVTNAPCNGGTGSATLTASGGTGAYTYLWSNAATASLVTGVSSGVYTGTVTDANGCSSAKSVSISAPPALTITAVASSPTLCAGTSVTLTANGSGGTGSITFTWVSGPSTNTNVVSPSANTTYTVNSRDANACAKSQTISLSVISGPTINVNSGSICPGQSFIIIPSGANTYTFSGGSATVTPGVTSNYTVTGTSLAGCLSASGAVSSVTVNQSPTITVSNATICSGQVFTLNPSGASTYSYSSGSATVAPTSNQSYSISGTSAQGCVSTSSAVLAVLVNSLPVISVNSGTICSGNTFTIAASGASTYTYSGGSATVSPSVTTSYSVTGTAANGCVSNASAISQVTVFIRPTLSLSNGSICPGNSFTLSPGGASTYTYLNGGPVVTPSVTTSYSVTGTSSAGCTAINTVVAVVSVTNTLVVSISGSASICSGQTATLSGNGATTYSWSSGPVTSTVSLSPTVNTTYTLYGVTSTCSNNAVVTVTVNANPTVSISGNNTVCAGSSVNYSATGAASFAWSTGATTPTISVSPSTNSNYIAIGTAANGCSAPANISTTVVALPTLAVNSGSICSGQVFTITASGASTYTYSGGSATVTPASNTTYTVTGTSTAGCVGLPATSSVVVNARPVISVNSGTICSGQTFTIAPSGAASYSYSSGSATVAPLANSSYSVTGVGANGCVSASAAISNVTVLTTPTITVSSGAICTGNVFTINPSGAATYSYSSGSATVSPGSTTSYTVTGTASNGCPNLVGAVCTVTVNSLPTLSVNSGAICEGMSFSINPSGASTYTITGGSAVVSPTINSSYTVTGTDVNGCISPTGAVSNVTVNANPTVTAVSGSSLICAGETATLIASGATSYSWNTSQTGNSIVVSPSVTNSYTVIGTNTSNCTGSSVVTQAVNPCLGINKLSALSGLNIYPNPNSGEFTVTLDEFTGDITLEIYDFTGQLVLRNEIKGSETQVSLAQKAKGIYILRFIEKGNLAGQKKITLQ